MVRRWAARCSSSSLIQAQRGRALAGGIGQLGHAVFQQGAALAQAEDFVAQHPVGGGQVPEALVQRAQVAAQGFDAGLQCVDLLLGLVLLAGGPGLPLLPAVPGGRGQGHEQQQDHDRQPQATARTVDRLVLGGELVQGQLRSAGRRDATAGMLTEPG